MSGAKRFIFYVLLTGLTYFLCVKYSGVGVGDNSPSFNSQLVNGESFSLSDLRGDYVLIDFWGSWCRPCLIENHRLVAFYQKYKDRTLADGSALQVLTVALEKTEGDWEAVARDAGFNWKYQVVHTVRSVYLSKIAVQFGVTNIPAKFLVGPNGVVLLKNPTFKEIDAFLKSR